MAVFSWEQVANGAGVGLCLVGGDGRVKQVNDAWARVTGGEGRTQEGHAGVMSLPVAREHWSRAFERAREGARSVVAGENWEGVVSRVNGGDPEEFLIVAHELPAVEPDDLGRLREALGALPVGVAISGVGPDGQARWIYSNEACLRLMGLSPSSALAPVASMFFRADRVTPLPQAEWPGARAAGSGESSSAEVHVAQPDGRWRVLSVNAAPLPDSPAGGRRGISFLVDVTGDWQTRQALQGSERSLQSVLDAAELGTWCHEMETGRIRFDERGREHYGVASPEVDATEVLEHIHPDDARRLGEMIGESLDPRRSSGRYSVVYRVLDARRRERWLSVQTWVQFEGEGDARKAVRGYGTSQDITARKNLEDQLLQAQKLDTLGRLAGGVAHDFNNMLVVILGYAEMLEESLREGAGSVEDVIEIRRAGERARALTGQLLAVARRQANQPKQVDLTDVIRDANRFLQRAVGEAVELSLSLAPASLPVFVDPVQINQVLMNLAVNARDAMPGGGKLVIKTTTRELDGEQHPGVAPGSYAIVEVSDSGEGLSAEAQEHMFEPFFTTKAQDQGTGLGLAIVHGIIKQAGGVVLAHSERGKGASFEIFLPLCSGDAPEASVDAPEQVASSRGERVLLVEDDEAVRALTARALRAGGFDVLVASNGHEALAAAPESFDLLVTDVVMPGMSGKLLAEQLRRSHPGLRVLYVSGYTRATILRQGSLEPGTSFLPKPFTPSELVASARAVLDSA